MSENEILPNQPPQNLSVSYPLWSDPHWRDPKNVISYIDSLPLAEEFWRDIGRPQEKETPQ